VGCSADSADLNTRPGESGYRLHSKKAVIAQKLKGMVLSSDPNPALVINFGSDPDPGILNLTLFVLKAQDHLKNSV
jgi:hypothetical protein